MTGKEKMTFMAHETEAYIGLSRALHGYAESLDHVTVAVQRARGEGEGDRGVASRPVPSSEQIDSFLSRLFGSDSFANPS